MIRVIFERTLGRENLFPSAKLCFVAKAWMVSIFGVGVGLHRALQAAEGLQKEGISADVLDLRTISLLDRASLCETAARADRVLVVDEDVEGFGLSGEVAAVLAEKGLSVRFSRVCTRTTIPFARRLEDEALPNVGRIRAGARELVQASRKLVAYPSSVDFLPVDRYS